MDGINRRLSFLTIFTLVLGILVVVYGTPQTPQEKAGINPVSKPVDNGSMSMSQSKTIQTTITLTDTALSRIQAYQKAGNFANEEDATNALIMQYTKPSKEAVASPKPKR